MKGIHVLVLKLFFKTKATCEYCSGQLDPIDVKEHQLVNFNPDKHLLPLLLRCRRTELIVGADKPEEKFDLISMQTLLLVNHLHDGKKIARKVKKFQKQESFTLTCIKQLQDKIKQVPKFYSGICYRKDNYNLIICRRPFQHNCNWIFSMALIRAFYRMLLMH